MAEQRKSDFTGERFGDWTVIGRTEGGGDRKRRWEVRSDEGVLMTVLQTDLKDLALAKTLAEKAAAKDAERNVGGGEMPGQMEIPADRPDPPLSLEEAEAALLRRLDLQIEKAGTEYDRVAAATNKISALERITLAREARASVALDGDTYSVDGYVEGYRAFDPFQNHALAAEQELAGAQVFDLSLSTLAVLAEGGICIDCENGNHPDLPSIEEQYNGLRTITEADLGDGAMAEFVETWVAPKPGVGGVEEEVFKVQLHRAAKMIAEARAKMDAAEFVLADVLEGLLP